MESPPLATYIPQKSKKRGFSDGSSSCMEPEVVEIMPPIARGSNSKPLKQKEVHHEIIDIDVDEDSTDVMVIDEKVDSFNKGKEAFGDFVFSPSAANLGLVDGVQSSKSFAQGPHNSISLDGFNSDFEDDEYNDICSDEFMYDDDYAILQAHFDNVDIPPGVEAPIPWLQDPLQIKKKPATASNSSICSQSQADAWSLAPGKDSSPSWVRKKPMSVSSNNLQTEVDALSQSHGLDVSATWLFTEPAQSTQKPDATGSSTYSSPQSQRDAMNFPPVVKLSKSWLLPEPSHDRKKPTASSSSSHHFWDGQLDAVKFPPGFEPSSWGPYIPNSSMKQLVTSDLTYPSPPTQMDTLNLPSGVDSPMYWLQDPSHLKKKPHVIGGPIYLSSYDPFNAVDIPSEEEAVIPWVHDLAKHQENVTAAGNSTIPSESISVRVADGVKDEILKKFELFKQFDTIQDHLDHYYSGNGSSMKQPSKNWAKKIQEEWRILEKDLPDSIFVRVYETRLDLLRAVIIGAEGTPYHDGLFFFDVFFPSGYPNVPPLVYYHSGGLRLNPNLYHCGKVCLSLLNTWGGDKNEKWIPGVSTMLQVLVSIQGLILNAKPYFNEPGFASMSGSESGEKRSQQYNENTFILSLKTMLYTMRRPPKHFEDFVVGHFCKRAHDILVACKAYMDGAQVGCLVKGGVQDVDEGDRSCSKRFKESLAGYVKLLVKAFTQIGVEDCGKFLSAAEKGNE